VFVYSGVFGGMSNSSVKVLHADITRVRVIKRDPEREQYIERHETSLLKLLIEKNPERAAMIIKQLTKAKPLV
jgi:hypothetical protein